MTIEEQVKYCVELAAKDIPVAGSLFQNKHYIWCLFIGHLISNDLFVREIKNSGIAIL